MLMKSGPRIAVVGASVRAAAFSLIRARCEVVAADLFADADLRRICPATQITNYPDGLAGWLADTLCDGWLYTGALENHPALVDQMSTLRPLFGNGADSLRRVRDPLLLQKVLVAVGVNFPETKPCDGTFPGEGVWLHKTGQGGNGSGVKRAGGPIHRGFGPPGQARRLAPKSGYWQRDTEGEPGSAQYLARADGTCVLLGVTKQLVGASWSGASEFQYSGTLAPWALPALAHAELAQAGQILASRFSLRGLFGVDFVFNGKRVWIVEVNPRVTAAMEIVERVTGRNLLAELLNDFGSYQNPSESSHIPAAGKVVLYAKQPLAVSQQMTEQLLTSAGEFSRPQLADIPNGGTQIKSGEPILTAFGDGDDLAVVEAELRQRVAELEMQLYRDGGGS